MATYSLVGWDKYQHYGNKRESVPWVKLHRDTLTSLAWIGADDLARTLMVGSMMLAARYQNAIPLNWTLLRSVLALRCSEKQFTAAFDYLAASEFLARNDAPCSQPASKPLELVEQSRAKKNSLPDGSETRPRPKGTRLAPDWNPTAEDRAYALERNLTDAEIDGIAEQFREYWTSADCPKPIKRDWPGTWRRWIARDAAAVIARRARNANPAARNAQPRQSVTAARDSILAKAGVRPHGQPETLRADAPMLTRGDGSSAIDSGRIIEADGWREVPGPADRTEEPDASLSGVDRGPGSPAGGLPQTADGLPGGRGALRADEPTGVQPVVASMGGAEGTPGASHIPPANDASSADDYGVIPSFLRRTA